MSETPAQYFPGSQAAHHTGAGAKSQSQTRLSGARSDSRATHRAAIAVPAGVSPVQRVQYLAIKKVQAVY